MKDFVSIVVITHNKKREVDCCVESLLKSNYKNFELIVVDDKSTDKTYELLLKKYKNRINIIKTKKELMAAGSRNLGARKSKGDYILFVDGDNVVDKNMIKELIVGIKRLNNAGMVGPLMYYHKAPDKILWCGSDINLWTSKTLYTHPENFNINSNIKVGHVPNVFMVRRELWVKSGGFDEEYIMHYEESDFAEKIKRLGYQIYLIPSAKTWHDVDILVGDLIYGSIRTPLRAYYHGRNRILFMKKNSNKNQYLFFLMTFLPFFTVYYSMILITRRDFNKLKFYLKGVFDGILNRNSFSKLI